MPDAGHISTAFARLQVEHFLVYLPNNGWKSAREVRDDRVRFELPDGDSSYVVLLPKSNQTPQCRAILQRVIYNLSGIEDREPSEILDDLLAARAAPPPEATNAPDARPESADAAPSSGGQPVRLRLRNDQDQHLAVRMATRPGENTLMPGEAIEVLCRPEADGTLTIRLRAEAVDIDDRPRA